MFFRKVSPFDFRLIEFKNRIIGYEFIELFYGTGKEADELKFQLSEIRFLDAERENKLSVIWTLYVIQEKNEKKPIDFNSVPRFKKQFES
jgi:hypothetical protein